MAGTQDNAVLGIGRLGVFRLGLGIDGVDDAQPVRVSQDTVQVLANPTTGFARVSQDAVQVLANPTTGAGRVSQAIVQVLMQNIQAPPNSQGNLGWFWWYQVDSPGDLSDEPTEMIQGR